MEKGRERGSRDDEEGLSWVVDIGGERHGMRIRSFWIMGKKFVRYLVCACFVCIYALTSDTL